MKVDRSGPRLERVASEMAGAAGGRISPARIEEAARVIDPVFLDSPQFVSESLAAALGVRPGTRLLCKVESLNPIRSFKGRGTAYYVHRLLEERGVAGRGDAGGGAAGAAGAAVELHLVCASAGNFGQGLAYAARQRGLPVTIFAAETANPLKIEKMRAFGARVELAGADFDAAKGAAREFAAGVGALYVEDGKEPAIAEGAGTIGVELTRWPEPLDTVLVPLGNGALLAGVGTWLRAHSPGTKVIGVCAAGAPSMAESWRAGRMIETASAETIADGIAVRVPIPEALEDLRGVVDDVVVVDDETIIRAMRLLHRELGVVIEPAGAAGVAAVLVDPERFAGQLVATPLCGGNLTEAQMERWL
jgi:threonine dehydratase